MSSSSFQDASWTLVGQSMPLSSLIVRIISIFSLVIGILSILPLIILVLMDISLYMWRMYWSLFPSRRQNTSSQSHHHNTPQHMGAGASTALVDAVGQNSHRPR